MGLRPKRRRVCPSTLLCTMSILCVKSNVSGRDYEKRIRVLSLYNEVCTNNNNKYLRTEGVAGATDQPIHPCLLHTYAPKNSEPAQVISPNSGPTHVSSGQTPTLGFIRFRQARVSRARPSPPCASNPTHVLNNKQTPESLPLETNGWSPPGND
jgi:hypothetical protein